jgi:hypothetical protein
MADLAQNTVQKISQLLSRLPKLPAEMTARNILIFCVISLLCFGSVMVAPKLYHVYSRGCDQQTGTRNERGQQIRRT